jgi:hypothetical protein
MPIGIRLLALLLLLGAASCAPARVASLRDDALEAPNVEVSLERLRQVRRALAGHPLAADRRAELDQSADWLDRAEDLAVARKVDSERLALVTQAIEAQLAAVKSYYDRKAADEALGLPGRPELSVRGGLR